MASSTCWNTPREIMTSAIWNVIERPCRTIFAPVYTPLPSPVRLSSGVPETGGGTALASQMRAMRLRATYN